MPNNPDAAPEPKNEEIPTPEKEWEVLVRAFKKLDKIQENLSENPEDLSDASGKVIFLESLEQGIEKLREHIVKKYLTE